jgi:hypothetical protein
MDERTKLDVFCIATFCLLDELYTPSPVLRPVRMRRHAHDGWRDVERITIVLVGEWQGHREAKALYRWVQTTCPGWCPSLPEWRRVLQRWKALTAVINGLRLARQRHERVLSAPHGSIDTLPLAVGTLGHAPRATSFRGCADWGYCASKDEHDFGCQVHGLITLGVT